jgi:hypothetical protein
VKWVPVPDLEKQPAIGVVAGGLLASYASNTEMSLRLSPFISKSYETDLGKLTPYLSFPLGLKNYDGESSTTAQFVLGSRLIHPEMAGAHYFLELGFDIDDAPTFIGIGATFPLNEDNLIDLWP